MNILGLINPERDTDTALISGQLKLSYAELVQKVNQYASILEQNNSKRIAVYLDNCIEWVIADLAIQICKIPFVALPTFFSQKQLVHIIENTQTDTLITNNTLSKQPVISLFQESPIHILENEILIYKRSVNNTTNSPDDISKVTYTSGSTGSPKGVCLDTKAQFTVTKSLATALEPLGIKKHLCVLPLSTLLENIAGVWAPLSIGATVSIPSLGELGYNGASNLDPHKFLNTITKYDPESLILVPELLNVLVSGYETGFLISQNLKFIAVGGAKVNRTLLERSEALGLPVYEGYGLSECCSVTTLNLPKHNKKGTAGKPLPHVRIRISADNEIEVSGSNMLGYLNQNEDITEFYPTGDLGEIDDDGFLTIHGRKKNMFITSYGRQVNPEWVEDALISHKEFSQVIVFGESMPFNVAVIVLNDPSLEINMIESLIHNSNKTLPDYAKVSQFIIAGSPFNVSENTLTVNGRLRRNEIWNLYQSKIQKLILSSENTNRLAATM